jgi:hypothetical protein
MGSWQKRRSACKSLNFRYEIRRSDGDGQGRRAPGKAPESYLQLLLLHQMMDKVNALRTAREDLTPAGALLAELVRRYGRLGMDCSLLEIQKLAWFLARAIAAQGVDNPLDLRFEANYYGPAADRLRHLLDGLDGSYLQSAKRIADSSPLDVIWFDATQRERIETYLTTEAKAYLPALEQAAAVIDGFESPFGMELLATVDWLLVRAGCAPALDAVMEGIGHWPAGDRSAARKRRLFDRRAVEIALQRLMMVAISSRNARARAWCSRPVIDKIDLLLHHGEGQGRRAPHFPRGRSRGLRRQQGR